MNDTSRDGPGEDHDKTAKENPDKVLIQIQNWLQGRGRVVDVNPDEMVIISTSAKTCCNGKITPTPPSYHANSHENGDYTPTPRHIAENAANQDESPKPDRVICQHDIRQIIPAAEEGARDTAQSAENSDKKAWDQYFVTCGKEKSRSTRLQKRKAEYGALDTKLTVSRETMLMLLGSQASAKKEFEAYTGCFITNEEFHKNDLCVHVTIHAHTKDILLHASALLQSFKTERILIYPLRKLLPKCKKDMQSIKKLTCADRIEIVSFDATPQEVTIVGTKIAIDRAITAVKGYASSSKRVMPKASVLKFPNGMKMATHRQCGQVMGMTVHMMLLWRDLRSLRPRSMIAWAGEEGIDGIDRGKLQHEETLRRLASG